jgi:hypothetical protein
MRKLFCRTHCQKESIITAILFSVTAVALFLWLSTKQDMLLPSGDATDIWKCITTFDSTARYPSYVLYKGFASIYPYVWLYRLSVALHVNEFFFIRIYHALLFSYITTIGTPAIVHYFTGHKPQLWQRILLCVTLFWFWYWTGALDLLMVDLPSCAAFIGAMHLAGMCCTTYKRKQAILIVCTGLLAAFCAGISGQYSLSALCLFAFMLVVIFKSDRTLAGKFSCTALLIGCFIVLQLVQACFTAAVVEPLRDHGNSIPTADTWLKRGIWYMMDKYRMFVPCATDVRGAAILQDYFGSDLAAQISNDTCPLVYQWSLPYFLRIVLQYPLDFAVRWIDRFFLCLSPDNITSGHINWAMLLYAYTLLYMAFHLAVTGIHRVKDFFSRNLWLVMAVVASVAAPVILSVENRYTLSLQAFIYAIAIAGPLPQRIASRIRETIREIRDAHSLRPLGERPLAWGLILGIVFVAVCMTHIASIYAQSGAESLILFH